LDRIEINIDLAYKSEYIYDYDPFDATLKHSFINKILSSDWPYSKHSVKWIVSYISQLLFIALCVFSFATIANILFVSNMDKISKSVLPFKVFN